MQTRFELSAWPSEPRRRPSHSTWFSVGLLLASLGFATTAHAEGALETPEPSTVSAMVEIDPMPFALSGHAVHIRLPIRSVPGLIVSAGTYGMEFPGIFVDLNSKNRDEGWHPEIDRAYAAFADYHFSGKPEGLFVGTQLAYQDFELERDESDERRDYGVILVMARVGTLWKPFDSGFFVLPWAGLFANIRVDDNNLQIGDETFDVAPVSGFATLHVGWQL